MDSLKILDQLWFEATSLEIRGWIRIYLLQMTSWTFFFLDSQFLPMKIFQKLCPKTPWLLKIAGNRRFCRSGHCSKHGWRHVARFFPSCWGCWDMPMFQMSAKGEWGIKQLWYSFLQCSRCDIEILKNLFMPAFFWPILCCVEGRVWRFPLKGSWWHELKGNRLFITGRRFYPRIKPQFLPMVLVDITSELPF